MSPDPAPGITPDEWFARLAEALAGSVGAVGDGADGVVDAATRAALLDLARVAAHSSERWAAPISTWLAGVALAAVPEAERAQRLAALVAALEAEPS